MKILNYLFTVNVNVNSCVSIKSNYNPFQYSYKNDIYYYGSIHRKKIKREYDLMGKVEDHHIIPKSLNKHPVIVETKFPIHCSMNIKMMPSSRFSDIDNKILIHKSHHKYNWFIKETLDEIYSETKEEYRPVILVDLIHQLYDKLNYKDNVPWN